MDTFYINLNEMSNKRKKLFRIWIIGAIIVAALAVLTFYLVRKGEGSSAWVIWVVFAVYITAYIYYARTTYKAALYIESSNYALDYKFGMLLKSSQTIIWETVKKVKFGPTYIAFFKRSGKRKVVKIGWLPYSKVVEIKDKIEGACKSLNVPYEIADYVKFD